MRPFIVLALSVTALGAADAPAITHSFLATGGRTVIVEDARGGDGKITWEYPAGTREGWVLPGGNVLLAVSKGGAYPGGAAIEVTRDKKIVWEYKGTQDELNSVQKTPEGTYVVTESGKKPRLLELDASGKVLVEFALQPQTDNSHMQTRMARKLADGTYLVPHLLAFAIKQYGRDGAVLSTLDTTAPGDAAHHQETWPFTAIRLPDGHTLAGLTHSNTVAEFDKDGKRVWELTNQDVGGIIKDACGVQRLPDGDTIVNSYAAGGANEVKLFEVTPAKKVVWTYAPPEGLHVHHAHVFATNGVQLPYPALR
jgi:hypothetical protein